jgi:hypothetical protein
MLLPKLTHDSKEDRPSAASNVSNNCRIQILYTKSSHTKLQNIYKDKCCMLSDTSHITVEEQSLAFTHNLELATTPKKPSTTGAPSLLNQFQPSRTMDQNHIVSKENQKKVELLAQEHIRATSSSTSAYVY